MQVRVMLMMMLLMMTDGLNSFLGPLVLAAAAPVYTPGLGPAARGLETPTRKPNRRQQTTEGDQRPSNEELTVGPSIQRTIGAATGGGGVVGAVPQFGSRPV